MPWMFSEHAYDGTEVRSGEEERIEMDFLEEAKSQALRLATHFLNRLTAIMLV